MHSFLLFRDNGLLLLHVVYSAQRLKELPKNRGAGRTLWTVTIKLRKR